MAIPLPALQALTTPPAPVCDPALAAKRVAAAFALEHFVESGMRLGLGSGSTAACFVECLGRAVAQGLRVEAVATSEATANLARHHGIPLSDADDAPILDFAFDGADEVDPALCAIKGGGGCLLRERLVARQARKFVLLVDESKRVECLGRFPLPIEVVPFAARATQARIRHALTDLGYASPSVQRRDGQADFRTENGNFVFDASLGRIGDALALARILDTIPGVVDHGLFVEEADALVFASVDGTAECISRVQAET